jgi:hypothetical protein
MNIPGMLIVNALALFTGPFGHPVVKNRQYYLALGTGDQFQSPSNYPVGGLSYLVRVGDRPGQLGVFYTPPLGLPVTEDDRLIIITQHIKVDGVLSLEKATSQLWDVSPDDVLEDLQRKDVVVFIVKEQTPEAGEEEEAYSPSNTILYLPWSDKGPSFRKLEIDADSNLRMGSELQQEDLVAKKEWVLPGEFTCLCPLIHFVEEYQCY